jgi:cyclin B
MVSEEMETSMESVDEMQFETLGVEDDVVESKEGAGDPIQEYASDIMAYLRKTEARRVASSTYMSKQTDVNAKMREIVIDWLVEVHLKFRLRLETLYLTVNIFDRFLERRAVKRTRLQLVGCTAMLIASKYEEIWAPKVKNFIAISDNAYTRDQIIAMEGIMLNTLKFNLTVPIALQFGRRYLKVAGGSNSTNATTLQAGGNQELEMLTLYLMELSLQNYTFLQYLPSKVAAAALYVALRSLGLPGWNPKLIQTTQYQEAELDACVRDIILLATNSNPKYKAVRKKYGSAKFLEASKMKIWAPPGMAAPGLGADDESASGAAGASAAGAGASASAES